MVPMDGVLPFHALNWLSCSAFKTILKVARNSDRARHAFFLFGKRQLRLALAELTGKCRARLIAVFADHRGGGELKQSNGSLRDYSFLAAKPKEIDKHDDARFTALHPVIERTNPDVHFGLMSLLIDLPFFGDLAVNT